MQITWRLPVVLLAASLLASASIIAILPQQEPVRTMAVPEQGPRLMYTVGSDINAYPPPKPVQSAPLALGFLLIGFPAATGFFFMVPGLQRLSVRLRLMDA